MLRQPTLDLPHELRLAGMAQAFEEQLGMPDIGELAFEDRLSLLLEREKDRPGPTPLPAPQGACQAPPRRHH